MLSQDKQDSPVLDETFITKVSDTYVKCFQIQYLTNFIFEF